MNRIYDARFVYALNLDDNSIPQCIGSVLSVRK